MQQKEKKLVKARRKQGKKESSLWMYSRRRGCGKAVRVKAVETADPTARHTKNNMKMIHNKK